MIFNIVNGAAKFATIVVTAPTNTTVTCVQSPYSFSKSTGSGTSVSFEVPKSGVWAITGTHSGIAKSETVNVANYGGTYSVSFTFQLWIFKAGEGAKVELSRMTQRSESGEESSQATINRTDYLRLLGVNKVTQQHDGLDAAISTASAYDLTGYSKIVLDLSTNSLGLSIRYDNTPIQTIISSSRATKEIDISSISGSHSLRIFAKGRNSGPMGGYIYNWYLE